MTEYKFVETSVVTDESIERIVNEWVRQGWILDQIHFVTAPSSKRPVMAFLQFTREARESNPVDTSGNA